MCLTSQLVKLWNFNVVVLVVSTFAIVRIFQLSYKTYLCLVLHEYIENLLTILLLCFYSFKLYVFKMVLEIDDCVS